MENPSGKEATYNHVFGCPGDTVPYEGNVTNAMSYQRMGAILWRDLVFQRLCMLSLLRTQVFNPSGSRMAFVDLWSPNIGCRMENFFLGRGFIAYMRLPKRSLAPEIHHVHRRHVADWAVILSWRPLSTSPISLLQEISLKEYWIFYGTQCVTALRESCVEKTAWQEGWPSAKGHRQPKVTHRKGISQQ